MKNSLSKIIMSVVLVGFMIFSAMTPILHVQNGVDAISTELVDEGPDSDLADSGDTPITEADAGNDYVRPDSEREYEMVFPSDLHDYLHGTPPTTPLVDNSIAEDLHHISDVWQAGYNGSGVNMALVDTGVDFAHMDLQGSQATDNMIFTVENETVLAGLAENQTVIENAHPPAQIHNLIPGTYILYDGQGNVIPAADYVIEENATSRTFNISFSNPPAVGTKIVASYDYFSPTFGWPIAFDPYSMDRLVKRNSTEGTWYVNTSRHGVGPFDLIHTVKVDGTDDFAKTESYADPVRRNNDPAAEGGQKYDYDLTDLLVTRDDNFWYFGVPTYPNRAPTTYGYYDYPSYGLYIDLDNSTTNQGTATVDPFGNKVDTLSSHSDQVLDIEYSPDGTKIATCSLDGVVKIWDAATGNCLQMLTGHTSIPRSLAWTPDSATLVSVDRSDMFIWDAATGALKDSVNYILNVTINFGDFYSPTKVTKTDTVSIDSTGQYAAVATDGFIFVVDILNTDNIDTLYIPGGPEINTVAYHPSENKIAAGLAVNFGGFYPVRIYDLDTMNATTLEGKWPAPVLKQLGSVADGGGHLQQVTSVDWHPTDPDKLVSASKKDFADVIVWDYTNPTPLTADVPATDLGSTIRSVKWNAAGDGMVAVERGLYVEGTDHAPAVTIRDANAAIAQTINGTMPYNSVSYNPLGGEFATAAQNNKAEIRDYATGAVTSTLTANKPDFAMYVESEMVYDTKDDDYVPFQHNATLHQWNNTNSEWDDMTIFEIYWDVVGEVLIDSYNKTSAASATFENTTVFFNSSIVDYVVKKNGVVWEEEGNYTIDGNFFSVKSEAADEGYIVEGDKITVDYTYNTPGQQDSFLWGDMLFSEFAIPRIALGDPEALSVELFSAGTDNETHAQDAVPLDTNVFDMNLNGVEDKGLDMGVAPVVQNEGLTIVANQANLLHFPVVEIRDSARLENLTSAQKAEKGDYDNLFSVTLFSNGNLSNAQNWIEGVDYTIDFATGVLTFITPPVPGDTYAVNYVYLVSSPTVADTTSLSNFVYVEIDKYRVEPTKTIANELLGQRQNLTNPLFILGSGSQANETVGTGDGFTTYFKLKYENIVDYNLFIDNGTSMVQLVENTDYTIDRDKGTVTMLTAPLNGQTLQAFYNYTPIFLDDIIIDDFSLYQDSAGVVTKLVETTDYTIDMNTGLLTLIGGVPTDWLYVFLNWTFNPIISLSNDYHFGFHPSQLYTKTYGGLGMIVVDETATGVYDNVYVDVNNDHIFDWKDLPMNMQNPIGAYDYINDSANPNDKANRSLPDGYPDLSLGMLYFIADGYASVPYSERYVQMYEIDDGDKNRTPFNGNLLCIMGDFIYDTKTGEKEDHGTKMASVLASRGELTIDPGTPGEYQIKGIAPESKLIAIGNSKTKANVFASWYFAVEGYDGEINTGDEAQIVVNGFNYPDIYETGWDDYSRTADYISSTYSEGKALFVMSSGDDGYGYGTVSSPGAGPSVLTVGSANDNYWLMDYSGEGDNYYYGDVSSASSKGPTALGIPKPEVLAIGSGFVDLPLAVATEGRMAYTSPLPMTGSDHSAALAGGVAALVFEAYYNAVHTSTDEVVLVASKNTTMVQLGHYPIVTSSLTLYKDGSSMSTSAYTVDLTTGEIVLDDNLTAGEVLTATYQFTNEYPSVEKAREFMISGADDRGYDVLSQGAGFINAQRSVLMASEMDGIASTESYWVPGDYMGDDMDGFASVMNSGESVTDTLGINNYGADTDVLIDDYVYDKIGEYTYSDVTKDKNMHEVQIGPLVNAVLEVKYSAGDDYDGDGSIEYALNGQTPMSTGIQPMAGDTDIEATFDIYNQGIDTFWEVGGLDIVFENNDNDVTVNSAVSFDYVRVRMTYNSLDGATTIDSVDTLVVYPNTINAADNTTDGIADLQAEDASGASPNAAAAADGWYTVGPQFLMMFVDGFDVSAVQDVFEVNLKVRYSAEDGYSGSNFVQYQVEGQAAQDTTIQPSAGDSFVTATYDLFAQGVDTVSEIYDLNIIFENNDVGSAKDTVSFDYVRLEIRYRDFSGLYNTAPLNWEAKTIFEARLQGDSDTTSDIFQDVRTQNAGSGTSPGSVVIGDGYYTIDRGMRMFIDGFNVTLQEEEDSWYAPNEIVLWLNENGLFTVQEEKADLSEHYSTSVPDGGVSLNFVDSYQTAAKRVVPAEKGLWENAEMVRITAYTNFTEFADMGYDDGGNPAFNFSYQLALMDWEWDSKFLLGDPTKPVMFPCPSSDAKYSLTFTDDLNTITRTSLVSNVQELSMANPASKIHDGLVIHLKPEVNDKTELKDLDWEFKIEFFKTTDWTWLELDSTAGAISKNISAGGDSFDATMNVPADIGLGSYQGGISLKHHTAAIDNETLLNVSLNAAVDNPVANTTDRLFQLSQQNIYGTPTVTRFQPVANATNEVVYGPAIGDGTESGPWMLSNGDIINYTIYHGEAGNWTMLTEPDYYSLNTVSGQLTMTNKETIEVAGEYVGQGDDVQQLFWLDNQNIVDCTLYTNDSGLWEIWYEGSSGDYLLNRTTGLIDFAPYGGGLDAPLDLYAYYNYSISTATVAGEYVGQGDDVQQIFWLDNDNIVDCTLYTNDSGLWEIWYEGSMDDYLLNRTTGMIDFAPYGGGLDAPLDLYAYYNYSVGYVPLANNQNIVAYYNYTGLDVSSLTEGVNYVLDAEEGVITLNAPDAVAPGGYLIASFNWYTPVTKSVYALEHMDLVEGSVVVYMDGVVMPAAGNFTVNHKNGVIAFENPEMIVGTISVTYQYYTQITTIPVLVNVASSIDNFTYGGMGVPAYEDLYNNSMIRSGYDKDLKTKASTVAKPYTGDRRYFFFDIPDEGLYHHHSDEMKLVLEADWNTKPSDIDIINLAKKTAADEAAKKKPEMYGAYTLEDKGGSEATSDPVFLTATNTSEEVVALGVTPGLNVVVLRGVVLDGSMDYSAFNGYSCDVWPSPSIDVVTPDSAGGSPVSFLSNKEWPSVNASAVGPAIAESYSDVEIKQDYQSWWNFPDWGEWLRHGTGTYWVNLTKCLILEVHIWGQDDSPDLDLGVFQDINGDGQLQEDEVYDSLCIKAGGTNWNYDADADADEYVKWVAPPDGPYIIKVLGFDTKSTISTGDQGGHFDMDIAQTLDTGKGYELSGTDYRDLIDTDEDPEVTDTLIPAYSQTNVDINWDFPALTEDGDYGGAVLFGTETAPGLIVIPVNIGLDRKAPTIDSISPSDRSIVNTKSPTIFASLLDPERSELDTAKMYIDGVDVTENAIVSIVFDDTDALSGYPRGLISYEPPGGLSEGAHRVDVTAYDWAGNNVTKTWVFTVDTLSAIIDMQYPADPVTYTNDEDGIITISGSSEPDLDLQLVGAVSTGINQLDDGTFTSHVTLAEGENSIIIRATDSAKNQMELTRVIYLDYGEPEINGMRSSAGSLTKDDSTVISGTASEPGTLYINGIEVPLNSDGTFSHVVELMEGQNDIAIDFTDRAGNAISDTMTITKDTLPPVLNIDVPDTVYEGSLNITGEVVEGATVTINGKLVPTTASARDGDLTFTKQLNLNWGKNTIVITVKDDVGNTMEVRHTVEYAAEPAGTNWAAIGLMIVLLIVGLLVGLFIAMTIWREEEEADEPVEDMPIEDEVEEEVEPEGEEIADGDAAEAVSDETLEAGELSAEDTEEPEEDIPPVDAEPIPMEEAMPEELPADESPEELPADDASPEEIGDALLEEEVGETAPESVEAEPVADVPLENEEKLLKLKQAFEDGKISKELYEKNLARLKGE